MSGVEKYLVAPLWKLAICPCHAGKVGTPSDIAELVAFLADGSKSGFITGQHFVVDGGVTKKMVYPE